MSVPSPADGDASIPWWYDHLAAQANGWRSAGFSATRRAGRLDGLALRAGHWAVEPAEVHTASSSYFGDVSLFPPGSATLDCALLMRDIPATWTAIQPAFAG